jgi:hypothetical protein
MSTTILHGRSVTVAHHVHDGQLTALIDSRKLGRLKVSETLRDL